MISKTNPVKPWMLSKEIFILYHGLRDDRTGYLPKLPALFAVIYLLLPIDLIPDFIPFVGYIDDLLVVPFLLNLSIRFLPGDVLRESQARAIVHRRKYKMLIFCIVLAFLAVLAGIFFLIRHLLPF